LPPLFKICFIISFLWLRNFCVTGSLYHVTVRDRQPVPCYCA
jgi:hypothetical protein